MKNQIIWTKTMFPVYEKAIAKKIINFKKI